MTAPFLGNAPVRTQHRMGARLMPRWLIAAGAVALACVSIDLFLGPPASALSWHTSQIQAPPVPHLDHSLSMLADEPPLTAGTSVAAYDAVASESPGLATAASSSRGMADDALEPGTSIAAYER
jgi:hypothetical protein